MLRSTVAEIGAIVDGVVVGDRGRELRGISTDSRAVQPGELFVAIRGELFDGHDFADTALQGGAAAVLVERGRGTTGSPRIEVTDSLGALARLAEDARDRVTVPVIAVTGSTGKTTTKDLLASALPGAWASPRSYNNEVGVPLTRLATPKFAEHVVVEVGSRGAGHIRRLLPAVRPDVAVITNLGVVHLETFGTRDRLADAKWELVEGLGPRGIAVLPAAEPRLRRSHAGQTVTFGVDTDADVAATDVFLDDTGTATFRLRAGESEATVRAPFPGHHQAHNITAVVGAGLAAGVHFGTLVAGLAGAQGSPWRMEIHTGSFTVVNDAYNANPDSVEAALRTIVAMPGRHVAVLGEMAELGEIAKAEHLRIGALASELGFTAVVTVGDEPGIAEGAGRIARRTPDPDSAAALLTGYLRSGDVVLVKASRAVGLESLAQRLVEEAGA
ncbi:MAG: UDP-N-acetylmuramoyl-tripeptide--D-alanyl-D-alanine ligase [Acidimicrobiia bacterium]